MKSQIITKSEQGTIEFAKKFTEEAIEETSEDEPLIFWLEGELGTGKTQFVKGIAQALGIKERITSPTFVLMKKFEILTGRKAGTVSVLKGKPRKMASPLRGKSLFFHIDAYRMHDSEDAKQIGLDEIIKNPRAVVVIEWAERIRGIIPRPYWELTFEHEGESERKINIKYIK